jgi:hypothetical protein
MLFAHGSVASHFFQLVFIITSLFANSYKDRREGGKQTGRNELDITCYTGVILSLAKIKTRNA